MNLEENRELGVVRLHNFNSRFPIHGKFLVPKHVYWEVALYVLGNKDLVFTKKNFFHTERYFASLMPLARNISPYRAAPKVKPFNPDEFIASLENCGPQLTSSVKGDFHEKID